jgi:hypothetical protein
MGSAEDLILLGAVGRQYVLTSGSLALVIVAELCWRTRVGFDLSWCLSSTGVWYLAGEGTCIGPSRPLQVRVGRTGRRWGGNSGGRHYARLISVNGEVLSTCKCA